MNEELNPRTLKAKAGHEVACADCQVTSIARVYSLRPQPVIKNLWARDHPYALTFSQSVARLSLNNSPLLRLLPLALENSCRRHPHLLDSEPARSLILFGVFEMEEL